MHPSKQNVSTRSAIDAAMEHSRAGDHVSAERICRQVLQMNPSDARAWCHLGTCCLIQNRLDEAAKAYEQAVHFQPQFPEALNNLAATLTRLGRFDEAIATFNKAAAQRPGWAEPYISLGNLLASNDRYDEATPAYENAVRAEPANPEPHCLYGSVMGRQGFIEEAKRHFLEALRLNPRYETVHSNLLLLLNHDPHITPAELLVEHRWFDRIHGMGLAPAPTYANDRNPDRCLNVAYVSPDFRKHAAASFLLPIFRSHDPARVKIFAYSQLVAEDEITAKLRELTTGGWRMTVGRTDAQVVKQMHDDKIDILVELAGHTGGNRLRAVARRPAPVQINYLGYPSTNGMASIQYRITDAIADPPGERNFHTEELVRLPGCFCCYEPRPEAPQVAEAPFLKNGFVTFGLLHKVLKLNDGMLDLWSDVLRAVPDSRLLIFRNTISTAVKTRLESEFDRRGIARQRVSIRSGSSKENAHLALYNEFDISLDSLPWSGHTTTCESLWMGVPMVTQRGTRHAGRMAASILTTLNMTDLIAESPEEYIDIAKRLAGDRDRLATLRKELRNKVKNSPLCDAATFTKSLEEVYRALWRRWCESSAKQQI